MTQTPTPETLQEHFGIPETVRFEPGAGGLTRAVLTGRAAAGEIYLHGAHVTGYQPAGDDQVMFVSEKSHFNSSASIRGGVPICFPWFADRGQPMHGLARLQPWDVIATRTQGQDITLELGTTIKPFRVHYLVTVGSALGLTLRVENTSDEPASFEAALHSYYAVSDAQRIHITGLEGREYADKTQDFAKLTESEPIRIDREVDRVYTDAPDTAVLHDPGHGRAIHVAKDNAPSTIVWNPWTEKAARLDDLADDDWQRFVCIESGCVHNNAVTLKPGQTTELSAHITVQPDAS